ncbi:MAG: hypothetical protein H6983_21105 [Ectothiorhodospiraceae bacterium]|nr:hypothetical protein [Ectothiorhodospiraceae bacterium]
MFRSVVGFAAALTIFVGAAPSHAAVIFNASQSGPDVVFSFSGSLDLTGLSGPTFSCCSVSQINPQFGNFGTFFGDYDRYTGLLTAPAFGTGGLTATGLRTGDILNVNGPGLAFNVQQGYVSGDALAGSFTFANATMASLGLTTGNYVYTLPNDTITLSIPSFPSSEVPLPASLALMLTGLLALGGTAARRRGRH